MDIGLAVAGDEVGIIDEIRHLDRRIAKAQMRYGDAAGFLGIISKISLSIHIGVIADDLDGTLIGADCTVGTEAPELAGFQAFAACRDAFDARQGFIGNIVDDAQSEVVLRFEGFEVFKGSDDVARQEFFRCDTIAAVVDFRRIVSYGKGSSDAVIERFAVGAGFLGAVQDGDLLDRIRQSGQEMFFRPGPEHVDVDTADLFAFIDEHLDRFFNGLGAGTHGDEDEFSIRSAGIVEQVVFTARDFTDFLHVTFSDIGNAVVEFIEGFAVLHKRFSRFAERNSFRIIRIHAAFAEGPDGIHIEERPEFFIRQDFDFLDFVGRAEAIEEVDDRDAAGNSRGMDDSCQVHDFLDTRFAHHADARAAHSHGIVMAGKNRIAVGGNCTGCDVEDTGQEFAGNLEHVAEHDHHALGRCKGRRQCAGIQSAVHSTGSPFFRLHFLNLDGRAKQVLTAMSSPFIDVFSHRRRRRYREDGSQFRKGVGNISRSFVAIHCLEDFLCHSTFPLSVKPGN